METLYSAVLGDLVSRSISFLVAKYRRQPTVQENLQRLHLVLLRSGTIVEEAEGRRIANRGMLQQLKILRDEMFRGYYVLDAFRYQALPRERNKDEEVSRPFALSRFNPAKRARFASSNSETMVLGVVNLVELQLMISSLESIIAAMKEFVIFLMSYPPVYRQPYSAHLFLDKCMFGGHEERQRVIDFLLHNEPPGARNLGVLPIVGPALIGKSTLVEHVCNDERVRNHFSLILFHSGNDLKDESTITFRGNCVTKHKKSASDERLLIIIELLGDVDEGAWKRLQYSSERCMAHGSKIIITSRSEKVASLGTTQAVRLKCLPTEAYWYFFKMLVFGSTDPEEHPKLASIAMELALEMRGSFMCAYIGAGLLRADFSAQNWCRVLTRFREYIQKNHFLFGEYPDDLRSKDRPRYTWRVAETAPTKFFLLHESYQKGPAQDEAPRITMVDLLSGSASAHPRGGKFEVLFWKSVIPPYYRYISACELYDTRAPRHRVG